MNSSRRRIASNYLISEGRLLKNPVVEIEADGTILSVDSYDEIDRLERTEHYSGVMVAGFVNAHCHLELSHLRGAITPGGGFSAFASAVAEKRASISPEQRMREIRAADNEMARGGVVAVGDIVNGESSFETKGASKIKYRNYCELFGLRSIDTSAIDALMRYPNTIATPHSLYSLNDPLLKEVAAMGCGKGVDQEETPPLSIHFMETPAEQELFEGRGALYEWYEHVGFQCDFLHYASPAERLVRCIDPGRSVMLVHNCCVTQHDIEMIMNHFTAPVYWAICPRSNSYISGLKPPVELLRRNGLNICVGTDSLASNSTLSMLDELREIEGVPLIERLGWATTNGARALGFEGLGDIVVGAKPSINIISHLDYARWEINDQTSITRI